MTRTTITQEILQEYYINKKWPASKIGREFGYHKDTITWHLRKWKFPTRRRTDYWFVPQELHNEIENLYLSGNSMEAIGKLYNFKGHAIQHVLMKRNCKRRIGTEQPRQYSVDKTFFKNINTEEKAYILGFLYADGCNWRKGFSIHLSNKDKEILEKFKICLQCDSPIADREKNTIILSVGSVEMSEDLTKLGCVPAKSLILKFPSFDIVPERLFHHFIRGYFDGDGYVGFDRGRSTRVSVVSSADFNNELIKFLENKNIKGRNRNKPHWTKHTLELCINSRYEAKKFLDYIYKDATIYLERKYQRYLFSQQFNYDRNRKTTKN